MLVLKSRVPWKPAIALASVARIAEKALVLHSVAAAAARIIVFRGLIPHPSCWMFGAPCCALFVSMRRTLHFSRSILRVRRPHFALQILSLPPAKPKDQATHRRQTDRGGLRDAIGAGGRQWDHPRCLTCIDHGCKKALGNPGAGKCQPNRLVATGNSGKCPLCAGERCQRLGIGSHTR